MINKYTTYIPYILVIETLIEMQNIKFWDSLDRYATIKYVSKNELYIKALSMVFKKHPDLFKVLRIITGRIYNDK